MLDIDKRLVQVIPSVRQINNQSLEFYSFVHFTVNTYTGKEWGDGTESPAIFNPSKMDAAQWVRAIKAAGMRGLILTCKHHDGFCLWPSRYTNHNIAYSPYKNGKGDIVKEVSDACREGGIRFGVYLSPWDRNKEKQIIGHMILKENILCSQRVEKFRIEAALDDCFQTVYEGTVIGYKKIVPLVPVHTDKIRIHILDTRVAPTLSFIGVY